jgi:hypothetical protein
MMRTGLTHTFYTDASLLLLMLVESTIVAYRESGDVLVHHVPEYGPIGYDEHLEDDLWAVFSDVHNLVSELNWTLIIGPISHPTDLVIGFDSTEPDNEWGYVWDVYHPDRSQWARSEHLAGAIDPDALPQTGRLATLATEVAILGDKTESADPRAVAIATSDLEFETFEEVDRKMSALITWLTDYRDALARREQP